MEFFIDTLLTDIWRIWKGQTYVISHSFFYLSLRNAGKILTKEQITSHVWNYDADILPNTVEVYIRNLRNKINRPFPDKKLLIHTVRGFGYKISNE